MNHKQVVKLHELVDGDVFYLLGDGKHTKMVLLEITTHRKTYTAHYREQAKHLKLMYPEKESNYDKQHKEAETVEVVFLRHKEAIA